MRYLGAVFILAAAVFAQERAEARLDLGATRPDPARRWTILLYLDGDNNLEHGACEVLDDFEGALPKGVEVIALFDRAKGYGKEYGDWTDARVFRVRRGARRGAFESEELARLGEVNMGDPAVLAAFLREGRRAFPARHTCLLMWNHGGGWQEQANDDDAPASKDGHDALTLAEFKRALDTGLAGTGKLDLVWFWMCLMGQLEVANAAQPYAETMIASEAIWWLNVVRINPILEGAFAHDLAPRPLATRIVELYREGYEAKKSPNCMVSAIDLARVPALDAAWARFAGAVEPRLADGWPAVSRSLFFAESYTGRTDYRNGRHATASVDLIDVAKRIRMHVPGTDAAYGELKAAFDAAVLASYAGPRFRLSHGLAVYAPVRADLYRPDYEAPAWGGFLRRLHETQRAGGMAPPKIADLVIVDAEGQPTESIKSLAGAHVKFSVEGTNLLWLYAQQMKPVPEGMAVLYRTFLADSRYEKRKEAAAHLADAVMPEYPDGRNEMVKEMGGLGFHITDGSRTYPATIDYSDPNDLSHARVPAVYAHPKQGRARVDIYFDVNWSRAAGMVAYLPRKGGGYIRQGIEPKPDAEITLLYEVIGKDGKGTAVATGTLKWGKGLELLPVLADPGDYAMAVGAESIGGQAAMKFVRYRHEANPELDKLVAGGKTLRPPMLVGDWTFQVGRLGESGMEFVDGKMTAHFRPDDKGRVLTYEMRAKEPTDEPLPKGIVFLDTRGAPCLVYFERQGERWARTDLHLAFYVADESAEAVILKDVMLGGVYRLVRARTVVKPKGGLPGTWVRADGLRLTLTKDRYTTVHGGRIMDQGAYRVVGDQLQSRSDRGFAEVARFQLVGDRLVLVYPNGMRFELRRVTSRG